MTQGAALDASMKRLEELLGEVERRSPPDLLPPIRDLVSTLLEIHRPGLSELLRAVTEAGGEQRFRALCEHPSVASLLLLHDLHPEGLAERVDRAVAEALDAAGNGARADVLLVEGARVQIRIHAEKPAAAALLRRTIERMVEERAPDAQLLIEGGEPAADPSLIPVTRLFARGGTAAE